ncbi:hypothetical protein PQ610_01975 [Tardisphaera miroshnichenkoae]
MKACSFDASMRARIKRALREHANVTDECGAISGEDVAWVIVSDGVPDVYVLALIAHKLDGKAMALFAKPQETRLAALKYVPRYLELTRQGGARGLKGIAFVIDQEADSPDSLKMSVEKALREVAVGLEEEEGGTVPARLWKYRATWGSQAFSFVIAVNGLGERDRSHTIEDHLLSALKIEDSYDDPKGKWESLRDRQNEAFDLVGEEPERCCPQQYYALKALERSRRAKRSR